ncbi:MAG: site-specific DNA-methyltransferase, partial [Desulfovibrionaceae bacterium]|nr:site-specific DNA-methyltransferase [Desulfovibrionaceae bacterium]
MDPPYGIKFNSNFQWSTTSRDVKDGKLDNMTREPEQVKAFRDTWRDGIHSYLSYLRDRFILARELLTESGSIFVQIGDENVHHIRELMDEVFGKKNLAGQIIFVKTSGLSQKFLPDRYDTILWYFNDISRAKYKQLYKNKSIEDGTANTYKWARFVDGYMCSITKIDDNKNEYNIYKADNITSQGNPLIEFSFLNKKYTQRWKTNLEGLQKLAKSDRLHVAKNSLQYVRLISDFRCIPITKLWDDTATGSFTDDKIYVVQTGTKTIERCILMSTDPGDLVLDPTCGSGTTAYVAEQWGRRWITIDTSRVALALARMRLMGARYPWYIMTDSKEGQEKEAELNNVPPQKNPTYNNIKLGFVNERVPHITLKSIANNAEIDVIYDKWQEKLEPLRASFNKEVKESYEEWEIPRDEEEAILKSKKQHTTWSDKARDLHKQWWDARIARQKEIDASISAHAEYEYLYDRPYENKKIVRVAGPFTVESLSPHRVLGLGADNELIDPAADKPGEDGRDFEQMILDNLRTAGVQQAHKEDKIEFTSLEPFAGKMICAQGFYEESGTERKAAVFIGPEFGTVGRQDLVQAAREAGDFGFDVLVSCAFNYDAQSTELTNLGKIQILKAR